ncbi:MAG: 50S ribosomal protein L18 [Anaplasmataceae bacterium]|nr:50S ribosomal protein L18 [Anaplasmataceae bacterium]
MKAIIATRQKKLRRAHRTGVRLRGGAHPRLVVFRSNYYTSVQLIDDSKHQTLASISTKSLGQADQKKNKTEQAYQIGLEIGAQAKKLKVDQAVFDRRSYLYHGRVRAVAEGARKAGLKI